MYFYPFLGLHELRLSVCYAFRVDVPPFCPCLHLLLASLSVLRMDSQASDGANSGLLEAKISAQTKQKKGYLPFNRLEHMQLMNMINDDVLTRYAVGFLRNKLLS